MGMAPSKKELLDSPDWIICYSKTRNGERYFFNKATGESIWEKNLVDSGTVTERNPITTPPISNIKKKLRTPAQDRLKRLQADLNKVRKIKSEPSDPASPSKGNHAPESPKNKTFRRMRFPKNTGSKRSDNQNEENQSSNNTNVTTEFSSTIVKKVKEICNKLWDFGKREDLNFTEVKKSEYPISAKIKSRQLSTVVPNCSKNTANTRLENFRKSLKQPKLEKDIPQMPLLTDNFLQNVIKTEPIEREDKPNSIYIKTEPCSDESSKQDNETEKMDWDPVYNITKIESTTSSSDTSTSKGETMGDHYLNVSQNLMRLQAENENHKRKCKWHKGYYYFVVDTNVLINNITFVKDLTEMKLTGSQGTIVYIPYLVLQELDNLKRTKQSEPALMLRVSRAIQFLNKNLEEKNPSVIGESAEEACQRCIDIYNPDDEIINCCLKTMEHIDKLVLLTEDINLQNKAHCNDVITSTISDLVSKHSSQLKHD